MDENRTFTRRRLMHGVVVSLASAAVATKVRAQSTTLSNAVGPYAPGVLPSGIRSRFVDNVNGSRMHVLEAGFDVADRPAVLLVHGFPELAFSWRKVMLPIASAGFRVIAPDLRGYGRTSGTDVQYDDDLAPFRTLNEVRDMLGLVSAFGYRAVAAVVSSCGREWSSAPSSSSASPRTHPRRSPRP